MYALMDRELFIRCRKADTELVEKAAKEASSEFEKSAGYVVETEIDADSPLPAESTGGVVILGHGGRIEFDDTLEDRLRLLESAALPNIRASIFGASASRKFFD